MRYPFHRKVQSQLTTAQEKDLELWEMVGVPCKRTIRMVIYYELLDLLRQDRIDCSKEATRVAKAGLKRSLGYMGSQNK